MLWRLLSANTHENNLPDKIIMFISMLHCNVLWHKLKYDQREKFPRKAVVHFDTYCASDFSSL